MSTATSTDIAVDIAVDTTYSKHDPNFDTDRLPVFTHAMKSEGLFAPNGKYVVCCNENFRWKRFL